MFNIYCHGICYSSYGFVKVICLHDTISLLRTPGSVNQRTSLNAKPNSIAFEITGGPGYKDTNIVTGFSPTSELGFQMQNFCGDLFIPHNKYVNEFRKSLRGRGRIALIDLVLSLTKLLTG